MGNDGGSIPTRRELVREGAREASTTAQKERQTEQQQHFWTTCALSHQDLTEPIVSDGFGKMFNKAAVLDHLLTNLQCTDSLLDQPHSHIKSLKDVVEIHFAHSSEDQQRWTCPITNKLLGPGSRAIYLVPCGHVFADSVLKEMNNGNRCLQCDVTYEIDDTIPILPVTESEQQRLAARMQRLGTAKSSHSLKPAHGKRSKKSKEERKRGLVEVAENDTGTNNIKDTATASLIARVLSEQEQKRRKLAPAASANVKSLFSNTDKLSGNGRTGDFMTRGYSIPADARR